VQTHPRQYPRIRFNYVKIPGKDVLTVKDLGKTIDGNVLFKNFSMEVYQGQKIAFLAKDPLILSTLFQILAGELEPDEGEVRWGVTATNSYFPKDNNKYFEEDINLSQWLAQYSPDQHINYLRGYLGRMLFTGEDADKSATVLSGGEKVRCMLAKMMVTEANVLIMDEPTNHLDLESITALNDSLIDFSGTVLFTSQDHQFIQTVADRIIEIAPNGFITSHEKYEDYMENADIQKRQAKLYAEETPTKSKK